MANSVSIHLRTKVFKLGSGSPLVSRYAQFVILLCDAAGEPNVPVVVRLDTGTDLTLLPQDRLRAAGCAIDRRRLRLSTLAGAFATPVVKAAFVVQPMPSPRIDATVGCLPKESAARYGIRLLKQAFGGDAERRGLLALHDLTRAFDVAFIGQHGRDRLELRLRTPPQ